VPSDFSGWPSIKLLNKDSCHLTKPPQISVSWNSCKPNR